MNCSDDLELQRLIDGDLDEIQSELVSHHAASCSECGRRIQEIAALRAFAQDELGAEDDGDEDAAAAALTRIGRNLPAAAQPRRAWAFAAASVGALALLLPLAFVTSVNAWTERILEKASARDRMWKYQPDKILYWEVTATSHGVRNIMDGEWRTRFWQRNGPTMFTQHSQQFDPQGRIARAYWRQPDGGLISYRPAQHVVEITPGTEAGRNALRELPPDQRVALNSFLIGRDAARNLERNRRMDADWLHRPSLRGKTATIDRRTLEGWGDVYHIVIEAGGPERNSEIAGAVHEYDIESTTYRLLRLKSTIRYTDGTTGVHDARWTVFREIPAAEFDTQTPQQLLGDTIPIIRLAPAQLARRLLDETRETQP